MKKSAFALILAALVFTLTVSSCDVSFTNDPSEAVTKKTSSTRAGEDIYAPGDSDTEDVFAIDNATTTPTGINLERVKAARETNAQAEDTTRATGKPSGSSATASASSSSAASASGSSSNTHSTSGSVPSTTEAPVREADILKSDSYLITGRMTADGVTSPYRIARSGDSYSVVSELQGLSIGIIMTGDSMTLLNPDKGYCAELTPEMQEAFKGLLAEGIDGESSDSVETGSGTEVIDGTKLDYVEYSDGRRDYYYEEMLLLSKSTDSSGKESLLYVDSVSAAPPASYFTAPASYEVVEVNIFMQYYLELVSTTGNES